MTKPLSAQFEDELAQLIDSYLLEGLPAAEIVAVLKYETTQDFKEILSSLKAKEKRA